MTCTAITIPPVRTGCDAAFKTATGCWRGRAKIAIVVGFTLLLGACAGPRMIGSQVESFVGRAGAVTGATYAFEQLPSQQSHPANQERIEHMAQSALERVGLIRSDANPRYSVLVDASVVQFQSTARTAPHMSPLYVPRDGMPFYAPLVFSSEPPWYLHTVRFVIRDLASGHIAYETTGRFEGPWSDTAGIWPTVMQAALEGYPNPPKGERIVNIELPPKGANTP